jgi:hypothetical protein
MQHFFTTLLTITPGTSCLATIVLSLRDKIHSTVAASLKLALMGFNPDHSTSTTLGLSEKTSLDSANKIQAGSLCYFALQTGTRGMDILR